MISERSCDTEDWSNDAENSVLPHRNKLYLQDVNNTGPEELPVSVFLTLHKSWDKIQPTEHVKLNQKVKQHL